MTSKPSPFKPKVSLINRGHHMDGWLFCAGLNCILPKVCPESNSMQTLESPLDETVNQGTPHYVHMQKDHTCIFKILQSMSEFCGL